MESDSNTKAWKMYLEPCCRVRLGKLLSTLGIAQMEGHVPLIYRGNP
jgi:hypothetical protein